MVFAQNPNNEVTCHFLDKYRADLAISSLSQTSPALQIQCSADFPEEEFQVVALPTSATGEAELTRDLLQQGALRLKIGGQMVMATNNVHDSWLYKEMSRLFNVIEQRVFEEGKIYSAIKTTQLKKLKNFTSEFAFRDQGRLIHAFSRPGVFSHRHLDLGARKLMDAMDIKDNDRVLDLGCGWGAVALAVAGRATNVQVQAIDSNARAIECTVKSAVLNNLENITTKLTSTGEHDNPGSYDLVVANPPYYSNFRIAQLFVATGAKALRPGGQILFVTKSPAWYQNNLSQWFARINIQEVKDYFIVSASKS